MPRFAEDANYWNTTAHPAASQGEIAEMLENFGATAVFVMTGQANGRTAWAIRFQWQLRAYRFTFIPLECREPDKSYSFGGKRRMAVDQSRYQMGRIAVNFVKAILTAAEATPAALFGFLELPGAGSGSLPATAAELDINHLTGLLPEIATGYLLTDGAS